MTVTAPIRLPARTAAALGDKVRRDSGAPSRGAGTATTRSMAIEIRVRLVKGGPARPSDVIGFVDNPDTDPAVLMDIAQALIAGIGARPRSAPPAAGDRWLVLAVAGELPEVSRTVTPTPSSPWPPTSRRPCWCLQTGGSRPWAAEPACGQGRFDALRAKPTAACASLPFAASRFGRRTARTLPLFPPPQKN